jgi:predicted pyridoxine 5'-phosphate oxidase superfamily flavin-nucleotide-binding protein
MSYGFLDIAATPGVRSAQAEMGVDHLWKDFEGHREFNKFTNNEKAFFGDLDSMWIATVSETGWPYIQHRGGPRGFLKLIDDRTLAFADYRGNRQYITTGNLSTDKRACLFLLDYRRRARMKIFVRIEIVSLDADTRLNNLVEDPEYGAKVERIFLLHLETFDWNCSQHITPRFTELEVADAVEPLRERLTKLELENAALLAQLATFQEQTPDYSPARQQD